VPWAFSCCKNRLGYYHRNHCFLNPVREDSASDQFLLVSLPPNHRYLKVKKYHTKRRMRQDTKIWSYFFGSYQLLPHVILTDLENLQLSRTSNGSWKLTRKPFVGIWKWKVWVNILIVYQFIIISYSLISRIFKRPNSWKSGNCLIASVADIAKKCS